jgi:hypothetical protein
MAERTHPQKHKFREKFKNPKGGKKQKFGFESGAVLCAALPGAPSWRHKNEDKKE